MDEAKLDEIMIDPIHMESPEHWYGTTTWYTKWTKDLVGATNRIEASDYPAIHHMLRLKHWETLGLINEITLSLVNRIEKLEKIVNENNNNVRS